MRGFPIRTSSDHGSFANSPRLIAGYNVLLRLLVPRHPPCALINLTTKIIQKRCSRPLCSSQATTGTSTLTPAPTHHTRPVPGFRAVGGSSERYQPAATRATPPPTGSDATRSDPDETTFRLFPQDPTACPADPSPAANRSHPEPRRAWRTRSPPARKPANSRCSTLEHRPPLVRQGQRAWTPSTTHDRRCGCQMLLRKEVIQPHLPVRLPCYDLVPIASPTFDSSLHKGWATGFGCYRLS